MIFPESFEKSEIIRTNITLVEHTNKLTLEQYAVHFSILLLVINGGDNLVQ